MTGTVTVLGGSSGIGRAVAEMRAKREETVHVIARSADTLADMQQNCGIVPHAFDARNHDVLSGRLKTIGAMDHLVLAMNAGSATGMFTALDISAIEDAFRNKVFPYMNAVIAAAPLIAPGGSVTFVTGAAGRAAMKGMGTLAATNGGLNQLVGVLALEMAPIRVNAVSPGVADTNYWSSVPPENRSELFDTVARSTPVGRVATAQEIADAVSFVMDHPFMTGAIIDCDGGARLK